MAKQSRYTAHRPDANGYVRYSEAENETWSILIERQLEIIRNRACDEYFDGVERLTLPRDRIPQLPELDRILSRATGWSVAPVPALIDFAEFFRLLAGRRFPVATFIRRREDLDYLQEPDIFHEIFGHCALLLNPAFAEFTATYGRLGLKASPKDRVYLARLYWFTVEFGLLDTPRGLRIYGGGILSSKEETIYALDSDIPQRVDMNVLDALRTPYRIDILQPLYYKLKSLGDLHTIANMDLMALVHEAQRLGLYPPLYEPRNEQAAG
jgi:phenylalanine-4-hydroxylase